MKNYKIEEMVKTNERNLRKAHCLYCGCTLEKGQGYMVFIPNRGRRVVCHEHHNTNGLLPYHGNALSRVHNPNLTTSKSGELQKTTVGIEFEIVHNGKYEEVSTLRRLIEGSFNCKAERDGSVTMELPSDYFQGLAKPSKILQSLEVHGMMQLLNNPRCGAHCHVQCNDVALVRRFYHTLFIPLYNYISSMDVEKRIQCFGSDFRYYAQGIDRNTDPLKHENFVNTQHRTTLEFRLPRITSKNQYIEVMKFWREVGYTINTEYVAKFTENNKREVAKKTSEKIINIAKKYFD